MYIKKELVAQFFFVHYYKITEVMRVHPDYSD